jgi:hypothetical protein
MTILARPPAPVNSTAADWPAWTDDDRWNLGPDAEPVAPYTPEDADWWAEQTRDDDGDAGEDTDAEDPAYHAHLDRLAEEREAEDRLCRGLLY